MALAPPRHGGAPYPIERERENERERERPSDLQATSRLMRLGCSWAFWACVCSSPTIAGAGRKKSKRGGRSGGAGTRSYDASACRCSPRPAGAIAACPPALKQRCCLCPTRSGPWGAGPAELLIENDRCDLEVVDMSDAVAAGAIDRLSFESRFSLKAPVIFRNTRYRLSPKTFCCPAFHRGSAAASTPPPGRSWPTGKALPFTVFLRSGLSPSFYCHFAAIAISAVFHCPFTGAARCQVLGRYGGLTVDVGDPFSLAKYGQTSQQMALWQYLDKPVESRDFL